MAVDYKEILKLPKELGKLNFSELVSSSTGHKIIPVDKNILEDKQLVKNITSAMDNLLKLTEKSSQRFTGNRINEIGKNLEALIVEELRKYGLEVTKLGRSGYPDFEIKQRERITYLEMKTSGNKRRKKTHHRMFYYSSGTKLKHDARHLLLQIQMDEEQSKYWKVVSWDIHDLSELKVHLKTEFNAGFKEFEALPSLKL